LIDLGGSSVQETCIARLADPDWEVRRLAAVGLTRQPTPAATSALDLAGQDPRPEVRKAALEALAATPGSGVKPALLRGLGDRDGAARRCAFDGVVARGLVMEATPVLLEMLPGEAVEMRRDIVRELGESGGPDALPELRSRVLDADAPTAQIAIRALAGRKDRGAVANLVRALESEHKGVRTFATPGLPPRTGRRGGDDARGRRRPEGRSGGFPDPEVAFVTPAV
jgi:HEAT repeat protein